MHCLTLLTACPCYKSIIVLLNSEKFQPWSLYKAAPLPHFLLQRDPPPSRGLALGCMDRGSHPLPLGDSQCGASSESDAGQPRASRALTSKAAGSAPGRTCATARGQAHEQKHQRLKQNSPNQRELERQPGRGATRPMAEGRVTGLPGLRSSGPAAHSCATRTLSATQAPQDFYVPQG